MLTEAEKLRIQELARMIFETEELKAESLRNRHIGEVAHFRRRLLNLCRDLDEVVVGKEEMEYLISLKN